MYKTTIKRLLDIIFSLILIVLSFPFFIIIGIIIKIDSKGLIFFTQTRVGYKGKKFKIIKFRTMRRFEDSYLPDGTEMKNEDRVTRVGKFLRKTSLDELPQIYNIFCGHMSFIGPRPTLTYQVEKYDKNQAKRLNVKPGISGLAQVKGRNSLTWTEKIEYDLEYVEKINIWLDTKIFFSTFVTLFKKEDIQFTNHDELSEHDGDIIDDVNK